MIKCYFILSRYMICIWNTQIHTNISFKKGGLFMLEKENVLDEFIEDED